MEQSDKERLSSLEAKVAGLDKESVLRDRALDIAAKDIDRRLDQMNELRAQITEERGEYLTRNEYNTNHKELVDKVDKAMNHNAAFITRAESDQIRDGMYKSIDSISNRVSKVEGGRLTTSMIIPWVLAALGVGVAVAALIVK